MAASTLYTWIFCLLYRCLSYFEQLMLKLLKDFVKQTLVNKSKQIIISRLVVSCNLSVYLGPKAESVFQMEDLHVIKHLPC